MKSKKDYISGDGIITLKEIRTGLIAGLLIYALFGFIDPFMAPGHYQTIWIIRFAIVCPVILGVLMFSYSQYFHRYAKKILIGTLFVAELSILAMIYIADQHEPASLGYYAGLILIILWSGFIFRFSTKESLFFLISAVLIYNIIVHLTQDVHFTDKTTSGYWLIANNFFLISSGILALIGTWSIHKFIQDIQNKNKALNKSHKALSMAKIKAEESDMLKSAFLSNLSHEIRTPMNGIIGFTQMIKDEETTREEMKTFADIITEKNFQLLHLINNILDLSEIQTGQVDLHFQNLNIHDSLKHIAKKYRPEAEKKGLKLDLDISGNTELYITTDHMRLRHILIHLLENAIKFTHHGKIELGYKTKAGQLIFYVQDTGIGIKKEYQEIIFENFRQLEPSHTRSYGGAGIGLAIAKNMTELLGGKISIDSPTQGGTCFFVSLPKDCRNREKQKPKKFKSKQLYELMEGRKLKILVVENNPNCKQYI
ncbi:MAG: HAMP domain-containing sensor histidine kinase, partial [Bacteroidales bacterium]